MLKSHLTPPMTPMTNSYNQLESWRLSAQDGPQTIEAIETPDALDSAFHLLLKNSHEGTLRISPNIRVLTPPDVFSKDEAFGAYLKYASTAITALVCQPLHCLHPLLPFEQKGSIDEIDDRANHLRRDEIKTEEARTNAKIQYDHWQRKQSELNRLSKSSLISMKRRLKRNDSDGPEGYEQAGRLVTCSFLHRLMRFWLHRRHPSGTCERAERRPRLIP